MIDVGRIAEMKTANYLRSKGYVLLEHSYKCRLGEIDLIMLDGDYLVFVEVKARSKNSIAQPKEFVDSTKQQRIIATAGLFLSQYSGKEQPRFDVVEVNLDKNKIISIKHLENAFTL